MSEWSQEVDDMPEAERRTAKGKAAVATCKQCARYLDPLFKLCTKKITSLIIEDAAWCCMLIMIVLETRIYIYEFRWYIRFVVIYVMVGVAAMLNLVLSVRQYYSSRYDELASMGNVEYIAGAI